MPYRIGIDLGGTLSKTALVAENGEVIACRRTPAAPGRDPRAVMAELAAGLRGMAAAAGLPFPSPLGAGIGVPGVVNHETGLLIFSGPLAWNDVDLAGIAAAELDCATFLDIDVNAGALADLYFGCAQDARDMLYVSWGTGVGGGFIVNRKLYHSRGGAMGNFGHIPADPASDRLCYCGCCGCLEVETGGKAMCEQIRDRLANGEPSSLDAATVTPDAIAREAAEGDALARSVLRRSAELMARSVAAVLSFLNPDTVVFGGGVSRCFPLIQADFDAELKRRTPAFSLPLTRVLESRFGENAGVVGAAMLPVDRGSQGVLPQ